MARGADSAAWIQGATLELGARAGHARKRGRKRPAIRQLACAASLIDLMKAFERVPHHILAREAQALGYPLWLLRLSLAAYRLPRRISIAGVLSRILRAARGLTAGSSFAMTELRVILIRGLDSLTSTFPPVQGCGVR